ncbi:MAG: arsenate reductase (glutaredoxin) [Gammaproteobacteria bacterium]|nr:arsenate reductase (glutaredoxin) [Gammaproteobacteria bacterium]
MTVIDYKADGLDREEVLALIKASSSEAKAFVRWKDDAAKSLPAGKSDQLTDEEIAEILVANPALLERPIGYDGTTAIIGRPPEALLALVSHSS